MCSLVTGVQTCARPILPQDRGLYCSTVAMMLYARTVALSNLGRTDEAKLTLKAFRAARARVPESRRVHNNTVVDLLAVADEMALGQLEYRQGRSAERHDGKECEMPWRSRWTQEL